MRSVATTPGKGLQVIPPPPGASTPAEMRRMASRLGIRTTSPDAFAASLPFSFEDTTIGIENEMQTAVIGPAGEVDLPITIRESNYYKNILYNTRTGSTSRRVITALDDYLEGNAEGVWENSWVRLPEASLCRYARRLFEADLRADKKIPAGPLRGDACRFFLERDGRRLLRIPVSYLLKLALADAIGDAGTDPLVRCIGERLMGHFLSDNTSPELFSFFPSPLKKAAERGTGAAAETAKRLLLCQLLVLYANASFELAASHQRVDIYASPQPPLRQKALNHIVSDAFYRELFMSPCLSGWRQGEAKFHYMVLCHQVLSRSQLNAIKKLKEANIITNNLVILPNTSNTSLANNGTHVSIGSKKLTGWLKDRRSGFGPLEEKYLGDLVIKIVEHFLPLFVGTYTAAPYRFDFQDFHPENVLGFLSHELDFTHLRMIWRRWKKKARLNVLGYAVTPFGPEWLDRLVSRVLGLRGDFVVDFRLIDYLVTLLSTDQSPALDGRIGNDQRLKEDLTALGVFDSSMPVYCLYRLRQQAVMGFSGFEGRYYSLYESLLDDLDHAIRLQSLLTALAFKYAMRGSVHHGDIPDTPNVESERRQIFFGAAIGIPTFFVHGQSPNRFLKRILDSAENTRFSRRYRGYIRVPHAEYRKALVKVLRNDAADLIRILGMQETVTDCQRRVADPENHSAHARLTRGILEKAGAKSPLSLSAREFNSAAERYYREELKKHQLEEGFRVLERDTARLDSWQSWRRGVYNKSLWGLFKGMSATAFLKDARPAVARDEASVDTLKTLIHLILLTVDCNMRHAA